MRPIISIRRAEAPPASGSSGLFNQAADLLGLGTSPPQPSLAITALRVHRTLAWPVGQGEAIFAPEAETPELGTPLQISGSTDGANERPLFAGRVLRSRSGSWGRRLLIEESTGPLARLHLDRAVRGSTAAKLIEELCHEAKVQVSVERPGATLPAYALQFGPSGMDHVLRLAQMSGLLARTDAQGKMRVETAATAPSVSIRPADGVIAFETGAHSAAQPALRLTGDGAMGSRGPGAEGWLLQSLDAVAAGGGEQSRHLPGLKAAADVARAATALTARQAENGRAYRLVLAGIPPVDLGEVIQLVEFGPSSGPARLVAFTLQWEAEHGLVSRMELHGIGV